MKLKSLILILGIVVTLVLIKVFYLKGENTSSSIASGGSKTQAIDVSAIIAHPQLLENKIFSSGTVMANEEVDLHPEVSGKLSAIYFKEGVNVQKGTLLAKMNDVDLQAQLHKLQLQQKLAKEREQRMKGLLSIGGVSQEEYDMVLNQVQTIASDIDYTRAQIAKTEIRSPFTGRIGLKKISQGAYVSTADIIASVQQLDVLKIDFAIPERYSSKVRVGDMIRFSVENKEGTFEAQVFAVEPKIDQQTRNMMIRAMYKNDDNSSVFPGAFAQIELVSSMSDSSIMIPTEAVIPELKGKKVFLSKGGKATPVMIQTGTRTDQQIEVVSGLKKGDTVIVSGIMSLKPGASLNIIKIKQ